MIEIRDVHKSFDDIKAVCNVSVTMKEKTVFGLIGTNGAGKSTLLRMLAGVMKADSGEIIVDSMPVFDNVEAKKKIYFIADEPYFFANANAADIQKYLSSVFENFKWTDYYTYLSHFGLDKKRKINTFSKGMKKQLAIICGICSGTKYLLCDETFDGLDPVIRQGVKGIFASEMEKRGLTPIIASHNLRELEDICDHVGLLHRGGVLLSRDLEEMKFGIQKIQCVFTSPEDEVRIVESLDIMRNEKRGSL
ncbi:MAG: ATP-binding cassette domain-containing protein, partial [Lachnospiraceae bacterium]|nr:ATP-binding cassette domain-containing protein [Lachnospiraceae bacterium]